MGTSRRDARDRGSRAAPCLTGWRPPARDLRQSSSRTNARMARFAGRMMSIVPRPNTRCRFRKRDQPAHPVQQRMRRALLRLDVHGLIAVDRIHDHGRVEPGRVAAREAARCDRRSTASACGRRCDRRDRRCRPCRSRRRSRAPACRAARAATTCISSIRSRLFSSSGARRRRMPLLRRIVGSAAYSAYM